MSARGGRPVTEADDWFRDQEKRLMNEARRPQIKKASDLLGPGIQPFAVALDDWNSPMGMFNGIWVTHNAPNSPTPTGIYLGLTIVSSDGHGTQLATSHMAGPGSPERVYIRRVHAHFGGARSYSSWMLVGPGIPASSTGTRPSAVELGEGASIYDRTLRKPLWSDGTVWRDAMGTAV